MKQTKNCLKIIVMLLFIYPRFTFGALDNPDLIGGESGYWIDVNPDLWPVIVVAGILLGIIFLMPRE